MLKSPQMAAPAGLHDISALPKPQVERLLKAQVLDLALFTAQVCEGEPQAIRYMVRRNPLRAEEVAAVRRDKQRSRAQWVAKQNASLAAQPRAQAAGALRECHTKLIRLKIDAGLPGDSEGRTIGLRVHAAAQRAAAKLAGCYGLKTDRPQAGAGTEIVDERYKDLALVEQAWRTCTTAHLEVRPVYGRTAASPRGHALGVR